MIAAKVFADFFQPFNQSLEYPAFACVLRDKVEDETIFLLTVAMDTANPLFKPHRVPGNVKVDHQPAELQVDPFTGGFGCDKHLCRFAEFTLCINASPRCIAVSDLQSAVNLSQREAPFPQLTEWSLISPIASKVIKGVFVLCENQQLHLRVIEDAFRLEDCPQLLQFGLNFAALQGPRMFDKH